MLNSLFYKEWIKLRLYWWLLLAANHDPRWMTGRDDSPWYPTMRLFRQSRPGDWPGVVARLRAALRECPHPAARF